MKVGIGTLEKPNLEKRENENLLKFMKSMEKKDPLLKEQGFILVRRKNRKFLIPNHGTEPNRLV